MRRKGQVVRVERARAAARDRIRLCPTPLGDRYEGSCYGSPPRPGERAHVFDYEENYLGVLVVESAASSTKNQCHHDTIFDFSYRIPGQARGGQAVPFGIAVFGMELDTRRARLETSPPDDPKFTPEKAKPWMGLDTDGNDEADLVVTAFDCSDIVAPPPPSAGQSYDTYCLDYWLKQDGRWSKIHRDTFHTCG